MCVSLLYRYLFYGRLRQFDSWDQTGLDLSYSALRAYVGNIQGPFTYVLVCRSIASRRCPTHYSTTVIRIFVTKNVADYLHCHIHHFP